MNVFVVKGKYFIVMLLSVFALFAGFFSAHSISVFMSGNRNLPIYSVDRKDNNACITFNCAWNDSDIDSILSTLKSYDIKATFFIVGDWAEKYPESLKKISVAGHEIGGHSYNHKDYAKLSEAEIKEDIKKCDEAIKKVIGVSPVLYRVPSGSYNNTAISAIEASKKIAIQWSADSIDYNDASAEDIYNRSIKLEKGGILLMHNGTKNTAVSLNRLLDTLTKRLDLVSVSELIYTDNFKIDANGCMHKN